MESPSDFLSDHSGVGDPKTLDARRPRATISSLSATGNGDTPITDNFMFGSAPRAPYDVLGVGRNETWRAQPGSGGYGGSGGTGGKLRSSKARVKKTPYDRPATGRHATPGGSAAMPGAAAAARTSIASRLKASASYLFGFISKLRFPVAKLPNGGIDTASLQEEEQEQGEKKQQTLIPSSQNYLDHMQATSASDPPGDPNYVGAEKKELDISDVENVLKQKTLSREQVNRLTEILHSRLSQSSGAAENLEMVKLSENSNRISDRSTPVEVACAYMGDQSTKPPGISTSPVTSNQRLYEDRYNTSPFPKTWSRRPLPVRMVKRRFVPEYDVDNEMRRPLPVRMAKRFAPEDDDDNKFTTIVPSRRVRQRISMLPTSSPYLCTRQFSSSVVPTQVMASSPPARSRQTAQKILETLETLSPSPTGKLSTDIYSPAKASFHKGKQLDEYSTNIATSAEMQTAETSMPVENQTQQLKMNYTAVERLDTVNCEPLKSSTFEEPLVRGVASHEKKGFRMNAVFEESNSDEETKLEINKSAGITTSGGLQEPIVPLELLEVPVDNLSPPNASVNASSSLAAESSGSPFPSLKLPSQPNGLFTFSSPESTVNTTVSKATSSFMSFPIFSSASIANVETKPFSVGESPSKFLFNTIENVETGSSFEVGLAVPTSKCPPASVETLPVVEKPPLPTLTTIESGSTITAESETHNLSSSSQSTTEVSGVSNTSVSTIQSSQKSSGLDESVKPSPDTPASRSEDTAAPLSNVKATSSFTTLAERLLPASGPVLLSPVSLPTVESSQQVPSISELPLSTVSNTKNPTNNAGIEPENVVSMATESPVIDKTTEVETMATDSMTEEAITTPAEQSATTSSLSPAPTFSFCGISSSALSSSFSFTSNSASSSGFKFGVMSDSTQQPTFGSPFSSSSAGSSNSSFGFGSSPSVAASSPFFSSSSTSTSSSPLQFGGATTSSTSSSIFGSGNSTSVFSFSSSSPSSTLSGTTPFLFGAGNSQQSTVSASSGQLFTNGSSQSNPFVSSSFGSTGPQSSASNLFAASGTSSPSSNLFGPSSSTPNPFASCVTPNTVSTFQFASTGSTLTSNPSPFSFGPTGSTLTSTPSPFSFGSTSSTSTSTPSPFSFGSTGSTQSAPTALSTFSFGSSSASSSSTSPSTTFSFGSTTSSTSALPTFSFSSMNSSPAFSFSSMTASSPSPSPFGSTSNQNPSSGFSFSSTTVPASFSFGSSSASAPPSSPFTFGSTAPAPNSSPFTFGSQPQAAPISNGQPFTFGGQQGTLLQSPFNSTGPTPSAPDFTGGFALGATGGEKSGRKFIKAKRLGGAKRGK